MSTNLEVVTGFVMDGKAPGGCVPAHTLTQIARVQDFELEVSGDKAQIQLGDTGTMVLHALPAGKIPNRWTAESKRFVIARPILLEALAKVEPTVCYDESRFVLNGIKVEVEGQTARFVSTEGRCLTKFESNLTSGESVEFAIPLFGMKAIQSLCNTTAAALIEFDVSHNHWRCTTHDGLFAEGKTIEGEWPYWRNVLPNPADEAGRFKVNTQALICALELAKLTTRKNDSPCIHLELQEGRKISIKSSADGQSTNLQLQFLDGPMDVKAKIAFDGNFLLRTLRVLGETVELVLPKHEFNPYQIVDKNFLCVLMPVRV